MTSIRIRAFLALILMSVAFAGAHAWRPTQYLADALPPINLETLFPKAFGDWIIDMSVPVQLVSPDTQAALNTIYNQTLSRTYINHDGERIMLSVAYGGDQSDATSAHRPEGCYPGQGFDISPSTTVQVQTAMQPLRARRLVARLGARIEPITYWIVVGDKIAVTGTEQKIAQLSYSMRGVIPDGMLVRVSSIDADADHAFRVHQSFIVDLSRALQPTTRSQIFGSLSD